MIRNFSTVGILSMFLAFCGVGCGSGSGGVLPGKVVNKSREVYLTPIADAENKADDTHVGSGSATTSEFRTFFAGRGIRLSSYPASEGYTLSVRYTNWEDHATQWSGAPDIIEMSVELLDNHDQQPVAIAHIKIVGSVMELTNPSPKELIPKAAKQAFNRIYGH